MGDMLSLFRIIAEDNIKLYIYGTRKEEKSIKHSTLCQPSILAVKLESEFFFLDIYSAVCLCQYILWALEAKISTSGQFPVIIFFKETNFCGKLIFLINVLVHNYMNW